MFLPAAIVALMSSRSFTTIDTLLEPFPGRLCNLVNEFISTVMQNGAHVLKGFSPIPPLAGGRQGRWSYFKNCQKWEGTLRM